MSAQNLELILKGKDYWNDILSTEMAGSFPADLTGTVTNGRGNLHFHLPLNISASINKLSNGSSARIHLCLLAGVAGLLYKYNSGQQIIIGTPVYKQETEEALINAILALRLDFTGGKNFRDLLMALSKDMKEAVAHQNFPLNTLLFQKRMADRETGISLIDVFVLLEGLHEKAYIHPLRPGILFLFSINNNEIDCTIEYDKGRFSSLAIQDITQRIIYFFEICLQDLQQDITAFNLPLAEQEKELTRYSDNGTLITDRDKRSFISLFEEQAAMTPAHPALSFNGQVLTYRELDLLSNQFARYLKNEYGILLHDRVAIKLHRSDWMLVAILSVLKAGGTYIPIDPEYPGHRIAYIESDSQSKLLLDQEVIDRFASCRHTIHEEHLAGVTTPEDLVYIIYTSGSTGTPKGVAVKNSNLVNYVDWSNKYYFNHQSGFCFGFFTSLSFDLTVTCIFTTLLRGDKIFIFPEEDITNIIANVFSQHQEVNTIKITPSHLNLARYLSIESTGISKIILGGEQLKKEHVRFLKQLNPVIDIYNEYGPTETTVGCTCALLTDETAEITIGSPIRNTNIYITDVHGNLLPPGIPGEMLIGGAGVAAGYFNNTSKTGEKFFYNPYANDGSRIYKSGDLAKWLHNGTISFIGRKDGQVKVNGFRIELDEIEYYLLEYPPITAATVLVKNAEESDTELYAFLIATEEINIASLRTFMKVNVPDYMIPHYFYQINEFPLTPNGKVDAKALLAMHINQDAVTAYVAPRNELENRVSAVWKEVLGKDQIGVFDDFFLLGGHSLRATRLMTAYKKHFGVHLSLQEIFLHPNIALHANLIERAKKDQVEPIPVAPFADNYLLSNAQKRLWLLSQRADNDTSYNIPAAYEILGTLDLPAFKYAIRRVIYRHDIFRTSFAETLSGEPGQWIIPFDDFEFNIEYYNLTDNPDKEERYQHYIKEGIGRQFNLAQPPLFQLALFGMESERHVLFLNMHHIISDAWSMEIMTRELFEHYNDYRMGREDIKMPLRIQYKDYASWHAQQLNGKYGQQCREYWLNKLMGDLPALVIPANKNVSLLTGNGESLRLKLNAEISGALRQLTQQHGASTFIGLLAIVKVLLHRYTGYEDIIAGTPIAGREHPDLENQIGFYVNTLALRTSFDSSYSFSRILDLVKSTTLEAHAHQLYPFDLLIEELNQLHTSPRALTLSIMVDMQSNAFDVQHTDILKIRPLPTGWNKVKFDLNFSFADTGDEIDVIIKYNTDKYTDAFIRQMGMHFLNLAAQLTKEHHLPVKQIDFLNREEHERLLSCYRGTRMAYPPGTVTEIFGMRVKQSGNSIAVVYEDQQLTYIELDELSNQLGHYLQKKYEICPEDKIGILLNRTHWLPVVLLGILKAGGAYVPIDPDYPSDRVAYIMQDSNCRLLLDEPELATFISNASAYAVTPVMADIRPEQLLYVIYTSGSTGVPKGVGIEHRNAVNIYHGWNVVYGLESFSISLLQLASISFDVFFGDVCRSLLMGGKMVICPNELKADPEGLYGLIKQERINIMEGTPGIVLPFMDHIRDEQLDISFMKVLILGSDTLNIASYHKLVVDHGSRIRIINSYGTTETTIDSLYYESRPEALAGLSGNAPIGCPFPNISTYILNADLMLQPVGVVGEICIGGAGLSRGYLNRPELTAEKFIPHPYEPGERLYRTGDLGRLGANGTIEFLGRKDQQIKIHGFRIEPAEIETVLRTHNLITDALVTVYEQASGGKSLVAYIVSVSDNEELTSTILRAYLSSKLPAFMLPAAYVVLEHFPLTPNGKIDRRNLPAPESLTLSTGANYIAPANEKERALIAVCEEVLRRTAISMCDDFFVMGGDSIKSIQVVSRLRQRGYQLQVRDVLSYSCLQELVRHMRKVSRAIPQHVVKGPVILSPIQRAFLQSNQPDKHYFNQSVMLYSRERIVEKTLKAVLTMLVSHHDALRMSYRQEEGLWTQYNNGSEREYQLTITDIREEVNCQEVLQSGAIAIQAGFDLEYGPLFHAGLFHCPDGDHLLLVIHHLIVDGVSWRILLEDLSILYGQYQAGKQLSLPGKTDAFQYWMEAQMRYSMSEELLKQRPYWDAIEQSAVPAFPADDPQGKNSYADEQKVTFRISKDITGDLQTRCHLAYKTTINDVLLTALGLSVQEVLGTDKFLVNLEGHGREHIGEDVDVTRTVGWFTCQFPVLIDVEDCTSETDALIRIKEHLHRIPNKGIGYGILRYLTTEDRKHSRQQQVNPAVTFNYLGELTSGTDDKEATRMFEFSSVSHSREMSVLQQREELLAVTGIIVNEALQISVHYSREQYEYETITALSASYERHLKALIEKLNHTPVHITPVDLTYEGLNTAELAMLNLSGAVEDVYELTPLQLGIYYHWLAAPESMAYCEQVAYRIEGELDRLSLEYAYQQMLARYSVLRTSFTAEYGEMPLQVVRRVSEPNFTYIDVSDHPDFDLDAYTDEDRRRGFNLNEGSQMRLSVLKTGKHEYTFLWSHHHILMDGWCTGIIIREFYQLYYSHLQDRFPEMPEVVPYREYIRWLRTVDRQASLNHWKDYLKDYDTVASVPSTSSNAQGNITRIINEERLIFTVNETTQIKSFCSGSKITENSFMQTVWGILLSKYNNTKDVVYGGVVSGRPAELTGVEHMVGLFINTVPIRIQYKVSTTVSELLQQVQQDNINGLQYHHVQLAEILSHSAPGRNLIDHLFTFQNIPSHDLIAEGVMLADHNNRLRLTESAVFEQTNYDFDITVVLGESIQVIVKYNTALYSTSFILRIKEHLKNCIEEILNDPDKKIIDIDYISNEEKKKIATEIKLNTAVLADRTVQDLFEEQVTRNSDRTCLIYEDKSFTYKELDVITNRFAHYIRKQYNLGYGDRVCIHLERSEWLIISMLAILKQGCVYVPVDPFYPSDRVDYILSDSSCKLSITAEVIKDFDTRCMEYSAAAPESGCSGDSQLYMIYTSGSTGQPKGVTVTHRNAVNICEGWRRVYGLDQLDVCLLQMASISFDVFFGDVCRSLLSGGRMVICKEEDKLDLGGLYNLIQRHRINIVEGTPMHIVPLMEYVDEMGLNITFLKILILGSDILNAEAYQWLRTRYGTSMRIINTYGTTETTIDTTYFEGDIENNTGGNTPIGKPFLNNYVYILDKEGHLLPDELPGEICIGGMGVSQGYWNRKELTQQRFREDPWHPGQKMYCTGDLGRNLGDGTIAFMGRMDDQVKIRGYRIELGEIEEVLRGIEHIEQAVVLARKGIGKEQELVAFLSASTLVESSEIRTCLRQMLPDVMIPAYFVQIQDWPLTPNGKIDKTRLVLPENYSLENRVEYVGPRNETESRLAAIWQELLGVKQVGIKDNFFDLGGHSITIMRLISIIRKEFDQVISIRTLFELTTVELLAQYISINQENAALESADYDVIKL